MMQDRFVQLLLGGLVVAVLLLGVVTWFGSRWLRENREEEADELLDGSAEPTSFDIALESCASEAGASVATISIVNRSDEPASFAVEVVFEGPSGFVLDVVEVVTTHLDPADEAGLEAVTTANGAGQPDTRCELLAVDDTG